MSEEPKNAYEILGISRNATKKDINIAFRKLGKKYHPDGEGGGDKEKYKDVSVAYEKIKTDDNRRDYDELIFVRVDREKSKPSDIFGVGLDDIFGVGFDWETVEVKQAKRKEERVKKKEKDLRDDRSREEKNVVKDILDIPENDIGLLAALVAANKSGFDGEWKVRKSEKDTRSWMPEHVYSVVKDGGSIVVKRIIRDWLLKPESAKKIKIYIPGGHEKKDPNYLFDEEFLTDQFLLDYAKVGTVVDFDDYLEGIKEVSKKIAKDEKVLLREDEMHNELRLIKHYTKEVRNNRFLKRGDFPEFRPSRPLEDKEWLKTITSKNYSEILTDGEKRLTFEQQRDKEGGVFQGSESKG